MTSPQSTSAPAEGVCSSSADSARAALANLYPLMDSLEAFRGEKDVLRISGKVGDPQDVGIAGVENTRQAIADAVKVLEGVRDAAQAGKVPPLSPSDAWHELVEKDDRTSPEEYPDMCLITPDELRGFMLRAKSTGVLDPADTHYYDGYEQARSDLSPAQSSWQPIDPDALRKAVIEECAQVADEQAVTFLSPDYAVNQPFSSIGERFACNQIALGIRALALASTDSRTPWPKEEIEPGRFVDVDPDVIRKAHQENVANIIYDAFPFDGDPIHKAKPDWVWGGNSIMQDRARQAAAAVLALTSTEGK